jgi:S-formylglutathione hydrolase FrmB
MRQMAARSSTSTWMDGFGEWSWPGLKPAVEVGPAAWVPALPRIEAPAVVVRRAPRAKQLPRPIRLARLVLLMAVASGTFVISSGVGRSGAVAEPRSAPLALSLGQPLAGVGVPETVAAGRTVAGAPGVPAAKLPIPQTISSDSAGASVVAISYRSQALGWRDRYLVYLPPGYRAHTARRYPVLYLLHGDKQPASSFLRIGVASTLDRLIGSHRIQPIIAVMLSAAALPNNWRNAGAHGPRYNDYIGEVQRLTDRVLRTIPARASRGIAGYSMGGFGAMNVALTQLGSYSLVESWEGFFAPLSGTLAADRPLLRRLPLRAFVYGASGDRVVGSAEDGPWAAALRAAGAVAYSAVWPGTHSFTPLEQHLTQMLVFAGRSLRS